MAGRSTRAPGRLTPFWLPSLASVIESVESTATIKSVHIAKASQLTWFSIEYLFILSPSFPKIVSLSFSFYFYLGLLFLLFALFLRYVLLRITHSTDFSERILVIFRLIKPSAMKMRLPTSVTAIYIYVWMRAKKKMIRKSQQLW